MGLPAFGTLLKIGDGAQPENFTTIAEVVELSGPSLEADVEEVTHHSATGGWKEFVVTTIDAGEVTFTINYLPGDATQNATAGLLRDLKNRTKRNFKLTFSDPAQTTWSFSAYVTAFEPTADANGALQADVTLKLTGQPTLA